MQKNAEGSAEDLLPLAEDNNTAHCPEGGAEGAATHSRTEEVPKDPVVVRLLQAVRHHARVIRARVDGPKGEETQMFSPVQKTVSC